MTIQRLILKFVTGSTFFRKWNIDSNFEICYPFELFLRLQHSVVDWNLTYIWYLEKLLQWAFLNQFTLDYDKSKKGPNGIKMTKRAKTAKQRANRVKKGKKTKISQQYQRSRKEYADR